MGSYDPDPWTSSLVTSRHCIFQSSPTEPLWVHWNTPQPLLPQIYTHIFLLPEKAFPTHSTFLVLADNCSHHPWFNFGITSSGKPSFTRQSQISAPVTSFIPITVPATLRHLWLWVEALGWKVLWLVHPALKKKGMWWLVIQYLFIVWMNWAN